MYCNNVPGSCIIWRFLQRVGNLAYVNIELVMLESWGPFFYGKLSFTLLVTEPIKLFWQVLTFLQDLSSSNWEFWSDYLFLINPEKGFASSVLVTCDLSFFDALRLMLCHSKWQEDEEGFWGAECHKNLFYPRYSCLHDTSHVWMGQSSIPHFFIPPKPTTKSFCRFVSQLFLLVSFRIWSYVGMWRVRLKLCS